MVPIIAVVRKLGFNITYSDAGNIKFTRGTDIYLLDTENNALYKNDSNINLIQLPPGSVGQIYKKAENDFLISTPCIESFLHDINAEFVIDYGQGTMRIENNNSIIKNLGKDGMKYALYGIIALVFITGIAAMVVFIKLNAKEPKGNKK